MFENKILLLKNHQKKRTQTMLTIEILILYNIQRVLILFHRYGFAVNIIRIKRSLKLIPFDESLKGLWNRDFWVFIESKVYVVFYIIQAVSEP